MSLPLDAAWFQQGVAIPAHPLALDGNARVDWASQTALTRYYAAAGAHGIAVGVHTTQFELHHDEALLGEVWQQAAAATTASANPGMALIAGICGDTEQAVREAEMAREHGYGAALLCGYGMQNPSENAMLERARAVGEVLPTIGFYLQESVRGVYLSPGYWRALFELESVVAVKAAPFDRYRTSDVAVALLESDRWRDIALLTGNDDTIVADLLLPTTRVVGSVERKVEFSGGLLGQWAVGTRAAVQLVADVMAARTSGLTRPEHHEVANHLVEVNAAVFDPHNGFAGCVSGINEMLRQQGLIESNVCLSPQERLSPGQAEAIAEVRRRYPELLDETFIAANRDQWRGEPASAIA
ncbi:dihydrodipicolinate synthase family protein [Tessaracoccus terricola]